jgi:hypothetical protein
MEKSHENHHLDSSIIRLFFPPVILHLLCGNTTSPGILTCISCGEKPSVVRRSEIWGKSTRLLPRLVSWLVPLLSFFLFHVLDGDLAGLENSHVFLFLSLLLHVLHVELHCSLILM